MICLESLFPPLKVRMTYDAERHSKPLQWKYGEYNYISNIPPLQPKFNKVIPPCIDPMSYVILETNVSCNYLGECPQVFMSK